MRENFPLLEIFFRTQQSLQASISGFKEVVVLYTRWAKSRYTVYGIYYSVYLLLAHPV
jgi:hypothetical protein